jgi:hypothetical protein
MSELSFQGMLPPGLPVGRVLQVASGGRLLTTRSLPANIYVCCGAHAVRLFVLGSGRLGECCVTAWDHGGVAATCNREQGCHGNMVPLARPWSTTRSDVAVGQDLSARWWLVWVQGLAVADFLEAIQDMVDQEGSSSA